MSACPLLGCRGPLLMIGLPSCLQCTPLVKAVSTRCPFHSCSRRGRHLPLCMHYCCLLSSPTFPALLCPWPEGPSKCALSFPSHTVFSQLCHTGVNEAFGGGMSECCSCGSVGAPQKCAGAATVEAICNTDLLGTRVHAVSIVLSGCHCKCACPS